MPRTRLFGGGGALCAHDRTPDPRPSIHVPQPTQVLGVPPDADSDTVNRAYNRKKYEVRGNDGAMARLEAAHSAVVMAALSARLAGGPSAVEPSARWADQGELFPWRPRWAPAERQALLVSAAVQAALMVYALVSPGTGTQPVVYTALAGAIGNVVKLNALFPPGSAEAGEELSSAQKVRGAKNVGRGLLLAVVATFAGCALFYSFPDAVASALGRSMPYWFYESEKLLLAAGSAVANWVITGWFR